MQLARDIEQLQQLLVEEAKAGKRVALVPTMGALHEGHMQLIRHAKTYAETVAVSIFVNPTQFGPSEDFNKYPRMLDDDLHKAHEAGAGLIYAPHVDDIYPEGFATSVSVGGLSTILEGASRPGHFDGVATVVTKLLLRVMPHAVLFGEKDYQQLCIIRRLVEDLDIPVEIIAMPTVRENDGLAMSSRNAYLSSKERSTAPKLHETLQQVAKALRSGANAQDAAQQGIAALADAGFKVDYLELRAEENLAPLAKLDESARLLVAAWLGKTRLIDNIPLEA